MKNRVFVTVGYSRSSIAMLKHLLQVFMLAFWIECSDAANHCCVNGELAILKFPVSEFNHRDDLILPEIRSELPEKQGSQKICKWDVSVESAANPNLQLVVYVNSTDDKSNATSNSFLINDEKRPRPIGRFQVTPLKSRRHLTAKIDWNSRSKPAVALRILVPAPGECSQDMLSLNGSCYAINSVLMNITEAIGNSLGSAQIASFSDMAQVSKLLSTYRAKRRARLDLSRWLRIGVFYRPADRRVLSVVRINGSVLSLQPVTGFEPPDKPEGPCGWLSAGVSGQAVLEFKDCSSRMPTLLSFPEMAGEPDDQAVGDTSELHTSELQREIEGLVADFKSRRSHSASSLRISADKTERVKSDIAEDSQDSQGTGELGQSRQVLKLEYVIGISVSLVLVSIAIGISIFLVRRRKRLRFYSLTASSSSARPQLLHSDGTEDQTPRPEDKQPLAV